MKLYLATGNGHKVGEVRAILALAGLEVEVVAASAAGGMPPVVEDAGSFEGNARKKALALRERILARDEAVGGASRDPADLSWLSVADDSGLCVDALGGAPGVSSARFAGEEANDAANTAKLLALLADVPPERRTAAFSCCIVAVRPAGESLAFEGRCPGRIVDAPRGTGGFGYDPVFVPYGYGETFAELSVAVKNTISHRARALARFAEWLRAGDR